MSRDRLPTGLVSSHPFRYMISILENATALSERRQPHAVLRNLHIFRLFPNLTFELQLAGWVCVLRVEAILDSAPPAGGGGG